MDKDIDEDIAVRYSGHRALCEIDLPGQRAIERGRVLVVGAGGLGSPVCLYLAAAGVGTIGIVDADTVSLSNLQRQIIHHTSDIGRPKVESAAVKMKAINPHVNVVTAGEMLTSRNSSSLVEGYDIVVDCTDNFDTRLLVNDTCVALGTPMVYGAVQRMAGQIFTYLRMPSSVAGAAMLGQWSDEYRGRCDRHASGHRGDKIPVACRRFARLPSADVRRRDNDIPHDKEQCEEWPLTFLPWPGEFNCRVCED